MDLPYFNASVGHRGLIRQALVLPLKFRKLAPLKGDNKVFLRDNLGWLSLRTYRIIKI